MSITAQAPPTIRDIIESGNIVTFFQPILSARQRTIIGTEALARGVIGFEALSRASTSGAAADEQLIQPAKLFGMAAREGMTLELERLCRATAVRSFASLQPPQDLILFLNFDAAALEKDPASLDDLLKHMQNNNLSPRNVAVEILESAIQDVPRVLSLLSIFRAYGFLLVLDDVGAGHSNLDRVPLIKPDILKLDRSLVVELERDYYRQETFKSLVQLARRTGALVVAEGVETEDQAIISLELGADLLQGYFLGRPEFANSLIWPDSTARVESLALRYKSSMIQRINDRKLQHRRFNIIINEILCELSRCGAGDFDLILQRLLADYKNVECVYVLDEAGVQVSSTVCNPNIPMRDHGVMFRPAPQGADHSLKEYYYVLLDVELQKYTTDPYVSLASGSLCRTISTCFRDGSNCKLYILCVDVLCE